MHSNKLVTCIKVAGKVLRESGDKIFLPFGSEYSIFLKNLNSVRALVRVSLDGQSVTDGEDLVVYGNSQLNLERFLKKGNMESGNRFKFIERSAKVEAHRGIEAEDGLLRVEFQFEKVTPKPTVVETIHKHYHDYYDKYHYPWYKPHGPYWYSTTTFGGGVSDNTNNGLYGSVLNNASIGSSGSSSMAGGASNISANTASIPMNAGTASATITTSTSSDVGAGAKRSRKLTKSAVSETVQSQVFLNQVNDAGITVPGSVSEQKFQAASWFAVDDEKFVIVLKLLGETASGHIVEKPVLVRQKQTCSTCGTRNRGQNLFCRDCGTTLEVVGESPKRRVSAKR